MPNLLTVQPPHMPDKGDASNESFHCFYDDGAYASAPTPFVHSAGQESQKDEEQEVDTQDAYYDSLLARFAALSEVLSSSPSARFLEKKARSIAQELESASERKWRYFLLKTSPAPGVIHRLNQETVIFAIRVLEESMTLINLEESQSLGAWAWSLLAKCREVGMMASEDVGVLRDLGKRARNLVRELTAGIGINRKFDDPGQNNMNPEVKENCPPENGTPSEAEADEGQATKPRLLTVEGDQTSSYGMDANDQESNEDLSNQIFEAQNRLLSRLSKLESVDPVVEADTNYVTPQSQKPVSDTRPNPEDSPSFLSKSMARDKESKDSSAAPTIATTTRISATLDMIITVIGERYGQRDLLEGRLLWDEEP